MVFGDITRKGDKLAVGEDGFAATQTIRLYAVAARPPYQRRRAGLPVPLANPPGDGFRVGVAGRPTAKSLAYQAGGSIYTVRVGDLATGCAALGTPRLLVRGGTSPSWGPAAVPARARR